MVSCASPCVVGVDFVDIEEVFRQVHGYFGCVSNLVDSVVNPKLINFQVCQRPLVRLLLAIKSSLFFTYLFTLFALCGVQLFHVSDILLQTLDYFGRALLRLSKRERHDGGRGV